MPQGLVVAHALHPGVDGLLVQDAPLVKGGLPAKPPLHQALEHLQLHLAHQLQVHLPQALVPHHVKERVLLLQLPQLAQGLVHVDALGQQHPVPQHRLQSGRAGVRLAAQPLSGVGVGEPRHRHHVPRQGRVHQLEFGPVVQPQLVGLAAPGGACVLPGGELRLHFQLPAGDLHPGQPHVLLGHLEHPGPKRFPLGQGLGQAL